jgi:hypothetical protein
MGGGGKMTRLAVPQHAAELCCQHPASVLAQFRPAKKPKSATQ